MEKRNGKKIKIKGKKKQKKGTVKEKWSTSERGQEKRGIVWRRRIKMKKKKFE